MPTTNRILTSILLIFTIIAASGQMKRMVACAGNVPASPAQIQSKEVYEYDCVDVKPSFPGGNLALVNFINATRRYPAEAYNQGVQGRVLCGFVVNEDGSISHITLVKGVEESLNSEAMRIISEMPHWESGKLNDRNVPVYCVLPIPFRL